MPLVDRTPFWTFTNYAETKTTTFYGILKNLNKNLCQFVF